MISYHIHSDDEILFWDDEYQVQVFISIDGVKILENVVCPSPFSGERYLESSSCTLVTLLLTKPIEFEYRIARSKWSGPGPCTVGNVAQASTFLTCGNELMLSIHRAFAHLEYLTFEDWPVKHNCQWCDGSP